MNIKEEMCDKCGRGSTIHIHPVSGDAQHEREVVKKLVKILEGYKRDRDEHIRILNDISSKVRYLMQCRIDENYSFDDDSQDNTGMTDSFLSNISAISSDTSLEDTIYYTVDDVEL